MLEFNKYFILFFEGINIFMMLYFFIQYIILQKKEFLFYGLYLLVLALYYLIALPDFFFTIEANRTETIFRFDLFKRPLQFMSSVFYSLFVMYYLRLKKTSQKLNSFLIILIWFYGACAFMCLLGNLFRINYDSIYYLLSLLLFPIQIIIVVALFRTRIKYSKFVIWGTLFVLIGSTYTLMLSIYLSKVYTEKYAQTDYSYLPVQVSILVDIILFSIALQRKIADVEKHLMNSAIQRQKAITLERERIIADLHDDVGGGLSSIRMMSDLMLNVPENAAENKTSVFAQKISTTAKDIAQSMHTIIWSLNTENDTIENFVEYIRQHGVFFFENTKIKFNFNTTPALFNGISLTGIQRKNLFLVAKEAFHNILKHSGADYVMVRIFLEEGHLMLFIEDNGTGIITQNQFGNGLKNMQKRINEIQGQISFSTQNGTTIKIDLPL
ncbi:MAG: hypothetical protein IPO46_06650 [Chitinophagaceae bacterium]|jgi:signal transduction histidine kinase|nr:hypothetical protein [Chitinophagaceae bacterium]MBP6045473.1 hypothetical protein [Ferruginibacter sp.]NMD28345.1 hypothetical protein [Bacteroidota bacterium]MBK8773766.1 hypothetical protein [Chitinophagaceae bacterium]MBL0254090.1 hypothetical protein [Chitinophagaceae bacterium]